MHQEKNIRIYAISVSGTPLSLSHACALKLVQTECLRSSRRETIRKQQRSEMSPRIATKRPVGGSSVCEIGRNGHSSLNEFPISTLKSSFPGEDTEKTGGSSVCEIGRNGHSSLNEFPISTLKSSFPGEDTEKTGASRNKGSISVPVSANRAGSPHKGKKLILSPHVSSRGMGHRISSHLIRFILRSQVLDLVSFVSQYGQNLRRRWKTR
jgi:hypothetical protein